LENQWKQKGQEEQKEQKAFLLFLFSLPFLLPVTSPGNPQLIAGGLC
jgi:hypothetical protein